MPVILCQHCDKSIFQDKKNGPWYHNHTYTAYCLGVLDFTCATPKRWHTDPLLDSVLRGW